MNEREHAPTYLIEGDFKHWRIEAEKVLKRAKEQEKKKDTIPVWYDERTIRLVSLEKIKRKKLEIIRVKIGKGELVFMEKEIAKKNGFIIE